MEISFSWPSLRGRVLQNARLEGAGGAAAFRLVVPALSPATPLPPPVNRGKLNKRLTHGGQGSPPLTVAQFPSIRLN